MTTDLISNVSDTARWVAAYRAWESARPDALFRDPLAARLAGQRGDQMARMMDRPGGMGNGWPIIARTKLLDDIVLASIAEGCTCVLNLAAGLDTRPYRLTLPADLRWIEADLPEILDDKERVLGSEQARCRLERARVDLADEQARRALFDRVDGSESRVLVITEGLVVYLEAPVVTTLGRDLAARKSFAFWALDFPSPNLLKMLQRVMGEQLINAPMKFAPADGVAFFEALGWKARDIHSLFHEGVRLRRVPWRMRPFAWLFPPADPRAPGKQPWSGVVRLERGLGNAG